MFASAWKVWAPTPSAVRPSSSVHTSSGRLPAGARSSATTTSASSESPSGCSRMGRSMRAMDREHLPQVVVLSTGGTIAGRGGSSLSLSEYKAGSLLGQELVEAVPELDRFARVRVEQICNVGSSNITFAHWRELAERIDAIFTTESDVAGVVITHGTSTIEETGYFLNLTVRHDRPVVLVGSQRPSTALSADGPLNLVNAVRVAACSESRGRGVLVVLNEEINAARDVTKSNTYRLETFRSGELGFLGYVDQDKVAYYRRSDNRHTVNSEFALDALGELPSVEIVYSSVQSNTPLLVETLQKAGVRGIVFAATGAGSLSDREKEVVAQSVARSLGTVFVRASRVGNGRVTGRSEFDRLGIIPADNLSPQKARVLLMLALARTSNLDELRRVFSQY
ncbi:MAG: type II asparaginase [Betaproteobacteria bacterium]|nr:type II asparaginase [Betaproteobacteria bacterium]